jgi:hypothetical protein
MRFNEFNPLLTESRGVTARTAGEVYTSTTDPNDTLTIQNIDVVVPQGAKQFETREEMLDAVNTAIPPDEIKIEDNKPTNSSKAAIVATVIDAEGKTQYWVRYIKEVPAAGVHGTWLTLKGYKLDQGTRTESIPIKATDIIKDDAPRTPSAVAAAVKQGIKGLVANTNHTAIVPVINTAVDLALKGQTAPIKDGAKYLNIVAKYGGEYLGPIAITQGNVVAGDISAMLKQFKLPSLSGATIVFPQNAQEELIDSILKMPNGVDINVSTKVHKGGGAASSLSGVAKQLTPAIIKKYPIGSQIITDLGTESSVIGPAKAALDLGIINQADYNALLSVGKASRNIADLKTKRLQQMTLAQGMEEGAEQREEYRVLWHALTAVVNAIMAKVNPMPEFQQAMLAALNNNNYLQLITDAKPNGNDLTLSYYGKFPAVFQGKPQLRNKSYFVTGQKGRLGFKLVY